MLKILIVDDERASRTALHYLLDKMDIEFQIYDAINGLDGCRQFAQIHPDIVILDINMPLVNGIDFMEHIGEDIRDTKIIIVSGYNDFKFAQKAIEYNVMGYLTKPINREELYAIMNQTLNVIEHDAIIQKKLQVADKSKIKHMFADVLSGKRIVISEYARGGYAEISRSSSYALCLIRWDFYSWKKDEEEKRWKEMNDREVYDFIEGFLEKKCRFCFLNFELMENVLIIYDYQSEFQVVSILKQLYGVLEEQYQLRVLMTWETGVDSLEQLTDAYRRVRKKLKRYNLFRENGFMDERETAVEKQREYINDSYKSQLYNCLTKKTFFLLEGVVEEIIVNMRRQSFCTISQAEGLLKEVISFADDYMMSSDKQEEWFNSFGYWRRTQYLIVCFQSFEFILRNICHEIISNVDGNSREIEMVLQNIKNYVDENYRQDINLDQLAERYNFSKQYLNNSFRKKYQKSIYEYVMMVRMERAEELFKNTNKSVKEIACEVGFSDAGYFGKVFKKYFQVSPQNYRK